MVELEAVGQASGAAVKSPLGTPAFHIRVAGLSPGSTSHLCTLQKAAVMAQVFGFLPPTLETRFELWVSSFGLGKHLRGVGMGEPMVFKQAHLAARIPTASS